jgi:hypothetical protein
VGPRDVLDAVVKRKITSPRRESNSRTPIVQPLAQRYTDRAITAARTKGSELTPLDAYSGCVLILHIASLRERFKWRKAITQYF